MFQFPSNGKAHVNENFEKLQDTHQTAGFQFPSNGKAHVNERCLLEFGDAKEFQFPSNGKAHVNTLFYEQR